MWRHFRTPWLPVCLPEVAPGPSFGFILVPCGLHLASMDGSLEEDPDFVPFFTVCGSICGSILPPFWIQNRCLVQCKIASIFWLIFTPFGIILQPPWHIVCIGNLARMIRSDSVKMRLSPLRGAHFQESGLQKDLPKAMKAQSKNNHFLIEESTDHLSVLGSILDVKMNQKALEKPSENQA